MLSGAVGVQSSVIAALLLTASGCGSTGAAGPAPSGNPGGSGGPWLLYSGGGVFALDASKPSAAVVTVDASSNVGGLRVVPRGTYAAATGTVSAVYALAGSDKQCGTPDDVVKATRLDAAATDAPVIVPGRRVSVVQAPSTGAITGWLVIDGLSRLVRTDAAFANPVQLLASVGFALAIASTPSQVLLLVQNGNTVAVRRFDPVAGTLDATALFTLPGGIASTVAGRAQDSSAVYMVVFDGSSGAYSLWRLPLGATQASSAI